MTWTVVCEDNLAISYNWNLTEIADRRFSFYSGYSALRYEALTSLHPSQHKLLPDGEISLFLLHSYIGHEVNASYQK